MQLYQKYSSSSKDSKDDNIEERWDKTISNDLKSVYLLSERVVVEMEKTKGDKKLLELGAAIDSMKLGSEEDNK